MTEVNQNMIYIYTKLVKAGIRKIETVPEPYNLEVLKRL